MAASLIRVASGVTDPSAPPECPTLARQTHDAGAELIEFALLLPILLLVVVGIFDFGFLFQQYQVITNAAREGARLAVLPHYTTADVQARVASYVSAGGVTQSCTTTVQIIAITPASGPPFNVAEVKVVLPHIFVWLGPIAKLVGGTFSTVNLTAVAQMRVEGP